MDEYTNASSGELAAAVTAIVTAIGAILEVLRRRWRTEGERVAKADKGREEILELLDKQHQVLRELADVLKHPNDTDFGVGPVKEQLKRCEGLLEKVLEKLEEDR